MEPTEMNIPKELRAIAALLEKNKIEGVLAGHVEPTLEQRVAIHGLRHELAEIVKEMED